MNTQPSKLAQRFAAWWEPAERLADMLASGEFRTDREFLARCAFTAGYLAAIRAAKERK